MEGRKRWEGVVREKQRVGMQRVGSKFEEQERERVWRKEGERKGESKKEGGREFGWKGEDGRVSWQIGD